MADKEPERRHFSHRVGLRKLDSLEAAHTQEDGCTTKSSIEQKAVERSCLLLFEEFAQSCDHSPGDAPSTGLSLNRSDTVKFLRRGLERLSEGYECLDASRPWICYWILHSLRLLGETVSDDQAAAVVGFLSRCQNPDGGFGGGPGQVSHLAPTYGAVNALCSLDREFAYDCIDRTKLVGWMDSLRLQDGSFIMHQDGEVDIRGVYCALSVARLTNIYTPELFSKTTQWVLSCQTYEGGFGGAPGMEAHGGYTFCGLAALILLDHGHLCNLDSLLRWVSNRQMRLEGGFQGRTNKLVDGCYSFWQGGVFPLIHMMLTKEGHRPRDLLFDSGALQEYLLVCCQDRRGGLIDKPGKRADYYHTCYALSGLSVAQYMLSMALDTEEKYTNVVGPKRNKLKSTHPLHNIVIDCAISASEHFEAKGKP